MKNRRRISSKDRCNLKRKLIIALLCAAAALLQTTLMGYIEIASIRPNLQVILATSFALMCGSKTGLTVGALAGFFLALVSGSTPGFYTLAYAWIGYLTGFSYRIFYDDDIKTPLLLIAGADLLYGLYQYITTFLIRGRIHFFFYLRRIIIPEMIYTVILAVFIYQLNFYINRKTARTYF